MRAPGGAASNAATVRASGQGPQDDSRQPRPRGRAGRRARGQAGPALTPGRLLQVAMARPGPARLALVLALGAAAGLGLLYALRRQRRNRPWRSGSAGDCPGQGAEDAAGGSRRRDCGTVHALRSPPLAWAAPWVGGCCPVPSPLFGIALRPEPPGAGARVEHAVKPVRAGASGGCPRPAPCLALRLAAGLPSSAAPQLALPCTSRALQQPRVEALAELESVSLVESSRGSFSYILFSPAPSPSTTLIPCSC